MLAAALEKLAKKGVEVEATAPIITTDPVGPSQRRFANGAALVRTKRAPQSLLALLKRIEHKFGRRSGGRHWRARVLDLDIVLWDGGAFAGPGLVIPHPQFRQRDFVLRPASRIAPAWRDPLSGLTLRQLHARLTRPVPLPRATAW